MQPFLSVRIAGLHFKGYATRKLEGLYVSAGGWEGWEGGVDGRRESIARPLTHGDFDVPSYLASREVTLKGFAVANSEPELEHMGGTIKGLLAEGEIGRLVVEYQGSTTWADCRRGLTRPNFKSVGGELQAEFDLSFWCPDPRKYGAANPFGPASSLTLFHYGNFGALPVFTVTGASAGGYTINGPGGRKFTVTTPLVGGVPHKIDMRTGYLSVAGVVITGGIGRADVWTVPGGAQVPVTVTGGSAVLSCALIDTFI